MLASQLGAAETIAALLKAGSDVDARFGGRTGPTALHFAAANYAGSDVLRVLLVLPVPSCACDWAVCVPDQGACAARARALSRSLTYGCVP